MRVVWNACRNKNPYSNTINTRWLC